MYNCGNTRWFNLAYSFVMDRKVCSAVCSYTMRFDVNRMGGLHFIMQLLMDMKESFKFCWNTRQISIFKSRYSVINI